jgi:hypothetical protein
VSNDNDAAAAAVAAAEVVHLPFEECDPSKHQYEEDDFKSRE